MRRRQPHQRLPQPPRKARRPRRIEQEKRPQHPPRRREVRRPEAHPRRAHEHEGRRHPEPAPHPAPLPDPQPPLEHQRRPVQPAPRHEGPGRPVPQPPEQHRHPQIAIRPRRPAATAPERDIHIVAQPGRQRDVPAPPELRHAGRRVRRVEVAPQLVAQQPRRGDRHVRVPREVAIDLRRVSGHRDPRRVHVIRRRVREVRLHDRRQIVRHAGLLDISDEEQPQRRPHRHRREPARRRQLRQERLRPHDRPRHQLGEERHEHRHVQRPARAQPPMVHVDRVAHRLKREEADPERQHQPEPRRLHPQQRRRRVDEEIVILEDPKDPQVRPQAQPQPHPPPRRVVRPVRDRVQPARRRVVDRRRQQQEPEIPPIPRRIEPVARRQQQPLARPVPAQPPVRHEHRDEEPQEAQLGEDHRSRPPECRSCGTGSRAPGPSAAANRSPSSRLTVRAAWSFKWL